MERTKGRIIKLGREHANEAVNVMAKAFASYLPMHFVLGDSAVGLEEGVAHIQRFYLDIFLEHDWPALGCVVDERVVGVALISPPERDEDETIMKPLIARLQSRIGEEALQRLAHYEGESESIEPLGRYHYLGILAVDPDAQRIGIGTMILRHLMTLVETDERSSGLCLSTEMPENVGYYLGHGFEVVATKEIADFTSWCMYRSKDIQ